MRKLISKIFYVAYVLGTFAPLKAYAQTGGFEPLPNPLKTNQTLIQLLGSIVDFLLVASILIGTVMIIYAGFLIMTSAGDTGKVEQGKKTILYVVIGLGVMLLFKVIIAIIGQIVGVRVEL